MPLLHRMHSGIGSSCSVDMDIDQGPSIFGRGHMEDVTRKRAIHGKMLCLQIVLLRHCSEHGRSHTSVLEPPFVPQDGMLRGMVEDGQAYSCGRRTKQPTTTGSELGFQISSTKRKTPRGAPRNRRGRGSWMTFGGTWFGD